MPTVPINTITAPRKIRKPNVSYAKPRAAEAMRSVTAASSRHAGALGSQANALGRQAAVVGKSVQVEQQRLGTQQSLLEANLRSDNAMFAGLQTLGNAAVRQAPVYERIARLRSEREADEAVADYSATMDRKFFGSVDPKTGARIPGAIDAPFSPSTEGDTEASGASRKFSEINNEWYEEGPYNKLSPRAKAAFDRKVVQRHSILQRKAILKDRDSYQQYKDMVDTQMDITASDTLNSVSNDTSQQATEQWLLNAPQFAAENAARKTRQLRANPENDNPDEAEWLTPEGETMYNHFRDAALADFTIERVNTMINSALAIEDPDEQADFLAVAEMQAKGTTLQGKKLLGPDKEAEALKVVTQARAKADQQQAHYRVRDLAAYEDATDGLMETGTPEAQAAFAQAGASKRITQTEKEGQVLKVKKHRQDIQVGTYFDLLKTSQTQAANYLRGVDPNAKDEIEKIQTAAFVEQQEAINDYEKARTDLGITLKGTITRSTSGPEIVRDTPRSGQRMMASEALKNGVYTQKEYEAKINEINEDKKEPDFIQEERTLALQIIEELSGQDMVDDAIAVQNGLVIINEGQKLIDENVFGDDRIEYGGQSYITSDGKQVSGRESKGIKLNAKSVVAILQYVTDYHRLNPHEVSPGTGLPVTTRELVQGLLYPTDETGKSIPIEVHNSRLFKLQNQEMKWAENINALEEQYITERFEALDARNAE